MLTISGVPTLPNNAVTVPMAANIPTPIPIPAATVPPFSITGSHAIPTCSKALPIKAIEPTMSKEAAATSATITRPSPRFLAKEDNLGESFVLTVSLRDCVASDAVFAASAAFPALERFLIEENVPMAAKIPPITSMAPIIIVPLSTPLQSPFFIASQFFPISSIIEVSP